MITVLLLSPAVDVTYLVSDVGEGRIHRPREVLRRAGGKGLNLARAASRLGAPVRVVAPLGGHTGAQVAELAAVAGVEVVTVGVAAQTRTCVTVAADDDGRLTEFYEPSEALTEAEIAAFVDAVGTLPVEAGTGWTVLSGSIPASVDLGIVVLLLRHRAALGESIAIDTHGEALARFVDEVPLALVKVNRHEAEALLGVVAADAPLDALELASAVRRRCGATVIITDGSRGSAGIDSSGGWRATSTAEPGRYPVGSGDTFLAGILASLSAGEPMAEALLVASTAAAANAAIPGAADFDPATARNLRRHTRVESL